MSRIFVTGASGFIGSNLVKQLTTQKHEVVGLVRDMVAGPWMKWVDFSLADCTMVRGDLSDFDLLRRVMADYEIEQVYHLGAASIVKTAHKDPIGTFQTNVMGTVNILEAARETGVKKSLILVTDKIFGDKEDSMPSDPYRVSEPYSASKIAQDAAAHAFELTYKMNILRVRSCNVYGYDLNNRIIPNTIRACLRGESPVIYKGEESTRQYIYVQDLVEALTLLMEGDRQGAVNVATNNHAMSQSQVVLEILRYPAFSQIEPVYVERPYALEIRNQSLKLSSFGWKPRYSFREGIVEAINRFKEFGY